MDPRLPSLLDSVIPPRDHLAGAGGLGLADAVAADAQEASRGRDLGLVLSLLPEGFASLPDADRYACLQSVAEQHPRSFATVVNMVNTAYYTDSRVLQALQARTGYRASPPQPQGYALEQFDEQMLQRVRQREPMWRRP
jgi:hypothetical protein